MMNRTYSGPQLYHLFDGLQRFVNDEDEQGRIITTTCVRSLGNWKSSVGKDAVERKILQIRSVYDGFETLFAQGRAGELQKYGAEDYAALQQLIRESASRDILVDSELCKVVLQYLRKQPVSLDTVSVRAGLHLQRTVRERGPLGKRGMAQISDYESIKEAYS